MVGVQARWMEGGIADVGTEQFDIWGDTSFGRHRGPFEHECRRAHAEQHAGPTRIEGQGDLLDHIAHPMGSGRGESRTDP